MATGGLWAKIHKWLALLMAVQILFWFASGLFFAVFPIERVRSEHMIAAPALAPIDLAAAAAGLARLGGAAQETAGLPEPYSGRLKGRPMPAVIGLVLAVSAAIMARLIGFDAGVHSMRSSGGVSL